MLTNGGESVFREVTGPTSRLLIQVDCFRIADDPPGTSKLSGGLAEGYLIAAGALGRVQGLIR
jgi:hypothetical protein